MGSQHAAGPACPASPRHIAAARPRVCSAPGAETMPRFASIPHTPVFFLYADSLEGEPKKFQHLRQKDFWRKQWLELWLALGRRVKIKSVFNFMFN